MVAWSFSALEAYELCAKKYYHEKIKRDVVLKQNEIQNYGKEAHKKFELRLINGKELPLDLRHHERVLKRLADAPGEGLPEQKLAINQNFQPTGFFDSDVWCRGVIDYVKINPPLALIVDHKFGKMKSGFDQVKLMAALLFCHMPELDQITAAYYWAKDKKITRTSIHRKEVTEIWAEFLPRVDKLQLAVKTTEFPARPNGLCKRHCPVKSCPYHGE